MERCKGCDKTGAELGGGFLIGGEGFCHPCWQIVWPFYRDSQIRAAKIKRLEVILQTMRTLAREGLDILGE